MTLLILKETPKAIQPQCFWTKSHHQTQTLFADRFQSIYKGDSSNDSNLSDSDQVTLTPRYELQNVELAESDILTGLLSLDVKKGAGPDGIPPIFLKECAYVLVKPLYYIFSRSLAQGEFPSFWKSSFLTAVYKNGARHYP